MDDWKTLARQLRDRRENYKVICKRTGKTEAELKKLFLQDKIDNIDGVVEESSEVVKKKFIPLQNFTPVKHNSRWDGNRSITFGLIGDTHLNSKYTQLTYLHQFYDYCYNRGINKVYHTGDIDEGEQMRTGHPYDCYTQGADEHVNEIVKNYPMRPGMETHFITGNHDASIYKQCGADIGKMIVFKREDMLYLGRDWAKIELTPKCILELRHPWDGSAYATSYKPQKMIESMDADSKPNILAIGHYHKLEYLFHRNVHSFQTGCFQSQTPFTRGKGLSVHIGGWIITVDVDDAGYIQRIVSEMIPFYKGIAEDYLNWERLRGA